MTASKKTTEYEKALAEKEKRIKAYKKLLAMTGNALQDRDLRVKTDLNEMLYRVRYRDFPVNEQQLESERQMIRALLDVGANPNYVYETPGYRESVFEAFTRTNRLYGVAELAKTDGFTLYPEQVDEGFRSAAADILWIDSVNQMGLLGKVVQNEWESKREFEMRKINASYLPEIVSNLFQKGIFPKSEILRRKFVCIIDPKERKLVQDQYREQVRKQMGIPSQKGRGKHASR